MGRSPIISLLLWATGAACQSAGAAGAQAHSLQVSVIAVADGDTITVLDSNQLQHRVRLAGIDAPEKQQAFGERSRQNLSRWVHRKTVRLEWSKEDKYGRWVAKVLLEPPTGCEPSCAAPVVVNLEQVRAGMAWHYKEYEREQSRADREAYSQAELAARTTQTGLWTDAHPVAPWDWRHVPSDDTVKSTGSVRKSRKNICHAPGMPTYKSVQIFTSFPSMEECIASGGRPPKSPPG